MRLFFLRQLRGRQVSPPIMVQFYRAIIESVLTSSHSVWYDSASARSKARLQRVVRAAERIIGCPLPSIKDLHSSRSRRKAVKITADPSHPADCLFNRLPSGRRYRAIMTKTSRHLNSFFPQAIALINSPCTWALWLLSALYFIYLTYLTILLLHYLHGHTGTFLYCCSVLSLCSVLCSICYAPACMENTIQNS